MKIIDVSFKLEKVFDYVQADIHPERSRRVFYRAFIEDIVVTLFRITNLNMPGERFLICQRPKTVRH